MPGGTVVHARLLEQRAQHTRASRTVARQLGKEKEAIERDVVNRVESHLQSRFLRDRQGEKEALENEVKTHAKETIESLTNPVRKLADSVELQLSGQARSIAEFHKKIFDLEMRLSADVRSMTERVALLEANLSMTVSSKIGEMMPGFMQASNEAHVALQKQVADVTRETSVLKGLVSDALSSKDEQLDDVSVIGTSTRKRLEDVENIASNLRDSQGAVEKLTLAFDSFRETQKQRENYTRRLEFLTKDMEGRIWPWRPNMERSLSPPRTNMERSPSPPPTGRYHNQARPVGSSDDASEESEEAQRLNKVAEDSSGCLRGGKASVDGSSDDTSTRCERSEVAAKSSSDTSSEAISSALLPSTRASGSPRAPVSRPLSARFRGRDPNYAAGRTESHSNAVANPKRRSSTPHA